MQDGRDNDENNTKEICIDESLKESAASPNIYNSKQIANIIISNFFFISVVNLNLLEFLSSLDEYRSRMGEKMMRMTTKKVELMKAHKRVLLQQFFTILAHS